MKNAAETRRLVVAAGRRCVLMPGDIGKPAHWRGLVDRAVQAFGRIDVLVNNAAHQMSFNAPDEISDEEWERTFAVNISAMFYIVKAAEWSGSTIINTASINSDTPKPHRLAYATTKGAIQNFTAASRSCLPTKESKSTPWHRARLDAAHTTMPAEHVAHFGEELSDQMARPAARASASLCDFRKRLRELCLRDNDWRYRRQAHSIG